jgi:hypothetical protein
MYLFSRRGRIASGNNRKAMAQALAVTEKVNQITSIGVSLYGQVYSPEVGTLVWSSFVPDLATLEAATDKLNADDGFASMVDDFAPLTTGQIDDGLMQLVYGQPDQNRPVEYVAGVQAVCANGNVGKGIEVGIEIAQRAEKATGHPTLFATTMTGVYGGVGWFTAYADIASMEAAEAAIAADASFTKFIDSKADVYAAEPLLTQQRVYRRIV